MEWIGIVATLFIVASMSFKTSTIKSTIWMRVLNLIGSIVFIIYGIMLPAYSTALMNTLLVFINGYHLIKLIKNKE